ncbi:GbsR/MarR family transcriptional regulator [Kibdelosporangium aridum]|uniref:DNA-binding transcriptional regulator GbsR, MarR family n=2 Tax=Kibdelosporangium aridum TaxID=2030 RepID=A0A1W2DM10_KIBAR|nr:MarR family transcriptional regulator [Kibdelosporangium aridum]SMC98489.1 DNA-binding transcriptional regulator GbsR, MarR family [Kibdelosporangium aridum]
MSEAQETQRDPVAIGRFIERYAALLADAGMQRMAARVFVALLCEDSGRMTATDMAESLQVSPAAISGAVRYLGQVNMLEREREPGSRRDYYVVKDDLWYDVITRREQTMHRWESTMREGMELLGEQTPAGLRWKETLEFYAFMHERLPMFMEEWKERRAQLHRKWGLND